MANERDAMKYAAMMLYVVYQLQILNIVHLFHLPIMFLIIACFWRFFYRVSNSII